ARGARAAVEGGGGRRPPGAPPGAAGGRPGGRRDRPRRTRAADPRGVRLPRLTGPDPAAAHAAAAGRLRGVRGARPTPGPAAAPGTCPVPPGEDAGHLLRDGRNGQESTTPPLTVTYVSVTCVTWQTY